MGTKKLEMRKLTVLAFGVLAISLAQVNADWSGSGELVCYSHYESDANFPEGASNEAPAHVTCRPVEWKYPEVDLGPEAMFFHPDMGAGFCTPNGVNDVAACGVAHCTGNIYCHGC